MALSSRFFNRVKSSATTFAVDAMMAGKRGLSRVDGSQFEVHKVCQFLMSQLSFLLHCVVEVNDALCTHVYVCAVKILESVAAMVHKHHTK